MHVQDLRRNFAHLQKFKRTGFVFNSKKKRKANDIKFKKGKEDVNFNF